MYVTQYLLDTSYLNPSIGCVVYILYVYNIAILTCTLYTVHCTLYKAKWKGKQGILRIYKLFLVSQTLIGSLDGSVAHPLDF